jgi:coenzyme F420-reducing hydrogenase beta subunit
MNQLGGSLRLVSLRLQILDGSSGSIDVDVLSALSTKGAKRECHRCTEFIERVADSVGERAGCVS